MKKNSNFLQIFTFFVLQVKVVIWGGALKYNAVQIFNNRTCDAYSTFHQSTTIKHNK